MHLFGVSFFTAGVLYALFEEQSLVFYFLLPVAVYLVLAAMTGKNISIRQKFMLGTWSDPKEGSIHVKIVTRPEKCQQIIQSYKGEERLTMTHFAIKACGQLMKEAETMNGKLVFGKWVPFDKINISCLVDIDGGKDLAMLLIEDVSNKSVPDIAKFIKEKASKIKKNKGDGDHKKRTGSAKFLPAFIVSALLQIGAFINYRLGMDIPPLAIKKNQFGVGCVTSLGMLNFTDAIAPFTGFANCVFLLSVNAVQDAPVVEDGKVVPGKIMNCNFTVDHRYVDGGRAKKFTSAFQSVFENPEKFLEVKAEPKKEK